MDDATSRGPDRRTAWRSVMGVGAAALALPLIDRAGLPLIGEAAAQGFTGVGKDKSDLVFIKASEVPSVLIAEWEDAKAATGPNRIAHGKTLADKAPATASRYEAKSFEYPTGTIRVLTWKKGTPVLHQVTFETELFVVSGSVTLNPIRGLAGKPQKLSAGDALFMPSGTLVNPKTTEDTVLLQYFVSAASKEPTGTIIRLKEAKDGPRRFEWLENGKEMSASSEKPDEVKKAPKDAIQLVTRRYQFDGNSIRYAMLKKGSTQFHTGTYDNKRVDVLIYIPKGRMRRKEGDQTVELVAGDTTREKKGNAGWWEVLEDSVFISTDAPVRPNPEAKA